MRNDDLYVLRLYITGSTPRSSQAVTSVHAFCEEYLKGHYDLKVIDVYQQQEDLHEQRIMAFPTLVKTEPFPSRRMVGDLSDPQKVIAKLSLDSLLGEEPGKEPR